MKTDNPQISALRQQMTEQRNQITAKFDKILAVIAARGHLPRLAIVYGKLLILRELLNTTPIESLNPVNAQITLVLVEVTALLEKDSSPFG